MFSRIQCFAKKHKRKFIATTAVLGGIVLLGKYAESKFKQWQDQEMKKLLEKTRKAHHFENMESTVSLTLKSLYPSLRLELKKQFDTENLVKKVKNSEISKVQGFERLKILSVSRILSQILCSVLLTIIVRVQLNILGGHIYRDTVNAERKEKVSHSTQESFLKLSQNFMDFGVKQICELVQSSVEKTMQNVSLKQKFDILELERLIRDINQSVPLLSSDTYKADSECNEAKRSPVHFCSNILGPFPQSDALDRGNEKQMLNNLRNDLLEVLYHNQDVPFLIHEHVHQGLARFFDYMCENFPLVEEDDKGPLIRKPLPLAKIIPIFDSYDEEELLSQTETLKQFSFNIYDAFTQISASDPEQNIYNVYKFLQSWF